MYTVKPTKQYRKSIKRLVHSGSFDATMLEAVIDTLAAGEPLDSKHYPHRLQGELSDCFECHVQGGILLMYRFDEHLRILSLVNVGTHSELFG